MNIRVFALAFVFSAACPIAPQFGAALAQTQPASNTAASDNVTSTAARGGSATGPATMPTGATQLIASGLANDGTLRLQANKSSVLTTARPIRRISVGEAAIADVNAINPTSLLVTAKKPGTTQIIVFDDEDHSQVIDVVVRADVY